MTRQIKYRSGYKYQLVEDYRVVLPFAPPKPISTEYILFSTEGVLTIKDGYAWDGPSGPTVDTSTFMRGSLVHDALYQLMRERHLPETYRLAADDVLRAICLEDGMSSIRAWWVYWGVRFGGGLAADPEHDKVVTLAPYPVPA